MTRVLLVWELGGGQGHVRRLLPIALGLRDAGLDPVLAICDQRIAAPLMDAALSVHPTPPRRGAHTDLLAFNYAELLQRLGLGTHEAWSHLIADWLKLFSDVKPALVVADFAPGALIAAKVARLPAATVGTGFAVPPVGRALANIRPWMRAPVDRMAAAETALHEALGRLLKQHGLAVPDHAADMFNSGHEVLCTLRDLDHYPDRDGGAYVGPIFSSPEAGATPWPAGTGRRVFAYFDRKFAGLIPWINCLRETGGPVVVTVPGVEQALAGTLRHGTVHVSDQPIDLNDALRLARLVVCHGGLGTVSQALLAGVPVCAIPQNPEQGLTAHRVEVLGLGRTVTPNISDPGVRALVKGMTTDPALEKNTKKFAGLHRAFSPGKAVGAVVDELRALP